MTTLLFLLTLLAQADDMEPLKTSVEVENVRGREIEIAVTCDFHPQTLSVGDLLYVQAATKNISQELLAYGYNRVISSCLVNDSRFFAYDARVQRRGETEFGSGVSDSMEIQPSLAGMHILGASGAHVGNTLQPGGMVTTKFPPCFVPKAMEYNKPIWMWDDSAKEEILLFSFRTSFTISPPPGGTAYERYAHRTEKCVQISQELRIKQRPKEEIQLVMEWSKKTNSFAIDNVFLYYDNGGEFLLTAKQWQEFEEKLTPGTLRNYIRVSRTLVEIAQDENKGKRQEFFNEMLEWINELHPLEKEGLTKRACEIVRENTDKFDREIAMPAVVP